MIKYLLLRPDEDGEPCMFLSEVENLLSNPEHFGIRKFLEELPNKDPMYWPEGSALLLEIKILKPIIKTTSLIGTTSYRLE